MLLRVLQKCLVDDCLIAHATLGRNPLGPCQHSRVQADRDGAKAFALGLGRPAAEAAGLSGVPLNGMASCISLARCYPARFLKGEFV